MTRSSEFIRWSGRKAERLLQYAPTTTIETGISKFVEWFSQRET